MDEAQIQAYIFGELADDQAAAVAAAIAANPELATIAIEYQQIKDGLKAERIHQIQQKIAQFEASQSGTGRVNSKKWKFPWRWVFPALLGAFLVIGYFYQVYQHQDTTLANKYYRAPSDPRNAGTISAEDLAFQDGLQAFDDENYALAIATFDGLRADSIYGQRAHVYLADAYFQHKNYPKAKEQFTNLSNARSNDQAGDNARIRWNMLMSELALGNKINLDAYEWPSRFRATELKADLEAIWR